jgi:hypothetical protein
MRKVLLKKPASMKCNPAFKGGKKDMKQKKIDKHLRETPEPESFSLKKLRKEAYNWKERVQFYLNEGDPAFRRDEFQRPFNPDKLKREKRRRMTAKKNKQKQFTKKELGEDNKGFEGARKKGANLSILKMGKNPKGKKLAKDMVYAAAKEKAPKPPFGLNRGVKRCMRTG